ncbi:hypothetical protein FOL47_005194 [Perkinsus chesapeaki]|uniref:Methyltransferase type 11 domain-containing protein n=1 Tax=Perkinsus chesapeaki TaxID=330153 RepID=A0A7J6LZF7_PERCH|nr:hypothetical protein FOL47_005194 [Perkinsus chesapeaki]
MTTRKTLLLLITFLGIIKGREIIAVTHEDLTRELGRTLDRIEALLVPTVTTCLLNVTSGNGGLARCSDWRVQAAQIEAEMFFNVTASVISPKGLAGRDPVLCETVYAIGRLGVLLSIVQNPNVLQDGDELLTDTWMWIVASNWHAMGGSTLRIIFPILYAVGWHLHTESGYIAPSINNIALWSYKLNSNLNSALGRSIMRGLRRLGRDNAPVEGLLRSNDLTIAYRMLASAYSLSCEYGCGSACLASASSASLYLGLCYALTEGLTDNEILAIAASLVGRAQLMIQSIFTQSFAEGLWLIHHTSEGYLWKLFYNYLQSPVILLPQFKHLKGSVEYQESVFADIFHNVHRLLPSHECLAPKLITRDLLWWSRMSAEEVYWRYRVYNDEYTYPLSMPRPLQRGLRRLISTGFTAGRAVKILDLGSGPLSLVGTLWHKHEIELVPVDPLAPFYRSLLHQVGVQPVVPSILGEVDNLPSLFTSGNVFDLAVSVNALDHTTDPVGAIFDLVGTVRPNGVVFLVLHRNEAEHEQGKGLHQWNFDVDDSNHLVVWRNRSSVGLERYDLSEMLLAEAAASVDAEVVEVWDDELLEEWNGLLGGDDDDVPHVISIIRKRS